MLKTLVQGFSYWVRNATTGPLTKGKGCDLSTEAAEPDAAQQLSQTRPVVFMHGVGFGLVTLCMPWRKEFVLIMTESQGSQNSHV